MEDGGVGASRMSELFSCFDRTGLQCYFLMDVEMKMIHARTGRRPVVAVFARMT